MEEKNIFGETVRVFNQLTDGLCTLHDHTGKIDDKLLNNPKGYIAHREDKSLDFGTKNMDDLFRAGNGMIRAYFIDEKNTYYLLRGHHSSELYKKCYYIDPGKRNSIGYGAGVKHPYTFENIPTSLLKSKNKTNFIEDPKTGEPLYCSKTCETGYFYDYDSIDCRICPPGCYKCTNYTHCSQHCREGMSMIIKPKYKSHTKAFETLKNSKKNCYRLPECQSGFFFNSKTSQCEECEENCVRCEMNPHYSSEPANPKIQRSRCLECYQPNKETPLFINSTTGQCQSTCQEGYEKGVHPFSENLEDSSQSAYCYDCKIRSCFYCSSDMMKNMLENCLAGVSAKKELFECGNYQKVINNISPKCRPLNQQKDNKIYQRDFDQFNLELGTLLVIITTLMVLLGLKLLKRTADYFLMDPIGKFNDFVKI